MIFIYFMKKVEVCYWINLKVLDDQRGDQSD